MQIIKVSGPEVSFLACSKGSKGAEVEDPTRNSSSSRVYISQAWESRLEIRCGWEEGYNLDLPLFCCCWMLSVTYLWNIMCLLQFISARPKCSGYASASRA